MQLKPQDILFLLKLVLIRDNHWTFNGLAVDLAMSPAEVHAASRRVIQAGLASREDGRIRPIIPRLQEFLFHGIRYVFVPERGEMVQGMPTSYAASPLEWHFPGGDEPPPVWPDPEGAVRGESFSPLYKSVPAAARNDPDLYELLTLVDAIRGGRAREHEMAKKELGERLAACDGQAGKPPRVDEDELVVGGKLIVSREALKRLAERHHIRRLVLFGSAARGELKQDSDIDLLVEFETGKAPSLGGMVRITNAFSRLFGGRKVDVATPNILNNPYRRRVIEQEMEELYAA